ncbi:YfaZ family outer membrane protein [Marinobacter sp. M216]|uniref:YfaZ family outer membrane protein n=1 Tax=Marinobacter albus TaxID=3030833 RepID=A0ABT7HB69_9GAMM|nr:MULTISPECIES: YfaZ family outer membrane protein [unclassified Marinobacter]MBW7470508.1 YfaZ family protein [Marinobacter sp. F4218]MDK9557224.1 YfaZ family outer membrane protein [Marinobacter sp. M216]
MKVSRISVMVLSLAAAPAFAGDVDLSLTDDSVKGQVNFLGNNDDLQMGAGYTYREGGLDILNLDFHAQGRTAIGNLPTTAGLGMRGFAWDAGAVDGGAIALGGYATLNIPRVPGLSFTGGLHYAPSILSFGDSDDLTSLELRGSYRVIRNAEVFAGYRYLNTELDRPFRGDVDLDDGVMAGMKIYF